ncbi:GAF domain-containing protein [Brevibacterium sp.]|uniref:GAF domain-containing protein n=1 Tax=Brevibacterium sp. TaxID=1701 RepID=UPI0025C2106C|nr:GAF domain-containing protein [Brevibacterium sp.]
MVGDPVADGAVLSRRYQTGVRRAKEQLIDDATVSGVRSTVALSWSRSRTALTASPGDGAPAVLDDTQIRELLADPQFSSVAEIIRATLVEQLRDTGLLVALADPQGRLILVEGDPHARRKAETMGFAPGGDWSEQAMGTSAPGMVVATRRAAQVAGAEHLHPAVERWSCSAVPLTDPLTDELLGVLDLTGGPQAVSSLALPLLSSAAAGIRSALAMRAAGPPASIGSSPLLAALSAPLASPTSLPPASPGARAQPGTAAPGEEGAAEAGPARTSEAAESPSGARAPVLQVTGPGARALSGRDGHSVPLGLRHAEILTLLCWHEGGLGAPQLGEMLCPEGLEPASVRVEMHRLRRAVQKAAEADPGLDLVLGSRPYRLVWGASGSGVLTDARAARRALSAGDVATAVRMCAGQLLPESTAPEIERIRGLLAAELRETVADSADAEVLWEYLRRPDAEYDRELWMLAIRLLPAGDRRRAYAVAQVERIDAELG